MHSHAGGAVEKAVAGPNDGGVLLFRCGYIVKTPINGDRHVCARASLRLCQSPFIGWRGLFQQPQERGNEGLN